MSSSRINFTPTNQILSQFPSFHQISKLIYTDPLTKALPHLQPGKDVDFEASKCRVLAIQMPNSYSKKTREKMESLMSQFFAGLGKEAPLYFFLNQNPPPLKKPDWVNDFQNQAEMFCLRSFGIRKNRLQSFTDEDLKVLRYTRKEVGIINQRFQAKWNNTLALQNISCFEYALLRAKERGVREQIFSPILDKKIMFERLERWGYETVESPQKGDLVLYIRDGIPSHMGYYLGENQVESKFGNDEPYSMIHPTEMVCEQYGSEIAFYRKNPKKEGKYLEENVIKFVYQ